MYGLQAGWTVAARGHRGSLRRSAKAPGRGKSGLHRTRWWVMPTVRSRRSSPTAAAGGRRIGKVQQKAYRPGQTGRGKGEKVGETAGSAAPGPGAAEPARSLM